MLAVRQLLDLVGEDSDREGLVGTPQRFIDAIKEYTWGYKQDPQAVLKTFVDGSAGYDAMVFQANIPIYSLCEHHLSAFFGFAHIAYIPKGKVVGLSKLARLADIFAKRLQVQERLCTQIADALVEGLAPEGVGVMLHCRHLCIESRGVRKPGTITITSALRGSLREDASVRAEFLALVNNAPRTSIL